MQDVNLVLADRYQVRERLGGGAGAEEYLGRDLRLDRPVVIQVIRGAGQDGFAPQARLMASLDHPAVASVYDWGQQHGMAYLIREFVPGEDLAALLRQRGTLPVTEAAAVGAEVAAALAAAHRIGLAHGNLDPAEVIVGEQRVTVVGFGAAWMRDQAAGDDGSSSSSSAADLQRDLSSLGAMLYQTVTGSAPAPGPATPTVGTSVPAPLRQVIARLLAPDPADRYQSAEAVRADLLHLTREPVEPVPARPTDATAPRPAAGRGRGLRALEDSWGLGGGARWRTRRRWLAALLGLALLGVAVGVAIVLSRQ